MRDSSRFDAFICHVSKSDGALAKAIRDELHRLGRKPFQLRARRIFVDRSSLTAGSLPDQIRQALENSAFLIVLIRPEMARRAWCVEEIATWRSGRSQTLPLLALTAGADLQWDAGKRQLRFADGAELPGPLATGFESEPSWVDLRRFRAATARKEEAWLREVARLAAPLHGFDSVDEIIGRDHAAQRRLLKLRNASIGLLLLLVLSTALAAWWASQEALRARDVARVAVAKQWMSKDPTISRLVLAEIERPNSTPLAVPAMQEALSFPPATVTYRGHSTSVNRVQFSPDGSWVATESAGETHLWRANGSGEPTRLEGSFLAFSPKGDRWVTISDGAAWLGSAEAVDERLALTEPGSKMRFAAFGPEGDRVLMVTSDGEMLSRRIDAESQTRIFARFESWVSSASFSPDGKQVLTTTHRVADKTAQIWSIDDSNESTRLVGHEGAVLSALFDSTGERIVTASLDGTARVWQRTGGASSIVAKGREPLVMAKWNSNGDQILTLSTSGTVTIHSLDPSRESFTLPNSHTSAAFDPSGERIATGTTEGPVSLWPMTGSREPLALLGHVGRVDHVVFAPDGKRLATASRDGTARVWHTEGLREPMAGETLDGPILALHSMPNESRVLTISKGSVRVWNPDGPGQFAALEDGMKSVRLGHFSPLGDRRIVLSADGKVRMIDSSGQSLTMPGPQRSTMASFGPAGPWIWAASGDGIVRIWDPGTTDGPLAVTPKIDGLESVLLSPNGDHLITVSEGVLRLWRVANTSDPVTLMRGGEKVKFASFNPQGDQVLSATTDGTALVWPIDGSGPPIDLGVEGAVITSAIFNKHGDRILMVLGARVPTIRRLDKPTEAWVFRSQGSRLLSVSFDEAGEKVVTVTQEGQVEVFSPTEEARVFQVPGERALYAAIRPGGAELISVWSDGKMRIWQLDPQVLIARIKNSTAMCLEIPFRQRVLAESRQRALRAYEKCEHSRGRGAESVEE